MRWIFVSLLFLNLAALVWGLVFQGPAVSVVDSKPAAFQRGDAQTLVLLSDASVGVVEPLREEPPLDNGEAQVLGESAPQSIPMKDGKLLCEMIGPFKDKEQAGVFLERLEAIDIVGELNEMELPAGSRYQVFLPPEDSLKSALRKLSELQSKKVDSYIIPKGELENGISLGMFSLEDLAKKQLKDMEAIGLKPEINIIERTYWEIWVMLAPKDGGKMSSLAWSRVMEGINDLERRQNFCLDVASQDNFH